MAQLHIFIDGTWLFNQCNAEGSLANATAYPDRKFSLSFAKLNAALLAHVTAAAPPCDSLGDLYVATSIFTLPADFDEWPTRYGDITAEQIEKTKRNVFARESFFNVAVAAGYKEDAVYRPPIRDYVIRKLTQRKYQEKQVDTSVVALLVRSAITKSGDFHVLLTGDADMLPAIRVAYPTYTKNVCICSTHPDELKAAHRQTSFSLFDFDFDLPPYFLQDHADKIIDGEHIHKCAECGKVFTIKNPLPKKARPYGLNCRTVKAMPARP